MLPERANKPEYLYINSCVLQKKQDLNRQEKREDWLTWGEGGEVEMEDYFMPVIEAKSLGKGQREDTDEEMTEV